MSETIAANDGYTLPTDVGVAIATHCFHELQRRARLPDPELPEDVLDVANTIMNHTNMLPEDLAELIPAVKVCMSLYSETAAAE